MNSNLKIGSIKEKSLYKKDDLERKIIKFGILTENN